MMGIAISIKKGWVLFAILASTRIKNTASTAEIGVRLKSNGTFAPKKSTDIAIKIPNRSFEVYCTWDDSFEICVWSWPELYNSDSCTLVHGSPSTNCPIKRVDNKCVVNINKFVATDHEGRWVCTLLKSNNGGINVTQNLNFALAPFRGGKVMNIVPYFLYLLLEFYDKMVSSVPISLF